LRDAFGEILHRSLSGRSCIVRCPECETTLASTADVEPIEYSIP